MGESRLEISNTADGIQIPAELCCNCATTDRVETLESELKLTRYLGMGGSEYTFTWGHPYCLACRSTATRIPVNTLHILLVVGMCTTALFLIAVAGQLALEKSLFGGHDFWVALLTSAVLVGGFYAARKPRDGQTSYYQPVRIRKLRQKFTTGEVTGIVLGFTSRPYMRRFQEANSGSLG